MASAAQKAARARFAAAARRGPIRKGSHLGRAGTAIRKAGSRTRTAIRSTGSRAVSKGLGYWLRRAKLGLAGTAGAVGVFLRDDGASLRERGSETIQRYTGVALDGAIDVTPLANNAMGVVTAAADDWLKRKTYHWQLVGNKHLLPVAGELVPTILAWDAAGIEGDARAKAIAAHDCLVESYQGYIPSTGAYPGISSPKLRAYLLASHGGRIASRVVSRFFPGIQTAFRDLFGMSA